MTTHRTLLSTLALAAVAAASLAFGPLPGDAGPPSGVRASGGPFAEQQSASEGPKDFIAEADQLSQPQFEVVQKDLAVPMADGEELYVEVTLPDPDQHPGQWPVIMEVSPYHGTIADREGIRIFPDPEDDQGNKVGMTGYFAPRGYAVVMVDLRGTGGSTGCLDHLGENDARDLKQVVEWAADQDWSTGKVGLTGHSYVGSTPSIAAGQQPRGLVTIAPSAGLASMYDHQFHNGVPYNLQWIGPMIAYEQLALESDLGTITERPEETGCGLPQSALVAGHGQVTGQYQDWHAQRDWRQEAARADIPIFMIHGVNDNAARIPAAEWFFGDRAPRSDDKVWIGQWDHGSAGVTSCEEADAVGHVNCRFDQWKYALHAWFDKHLQGRDVDTGPTVEAFFDDAVATTTDRWDRDADERWTLYPDAGDGSLGLTPPEGTGTATFTSLAGDGATEFVSEPLTDDQVLLGLPELQLDVSVTAGVALQLVTTLYRETPDGQRVPMNHCAGTTHLRNDVATPALVVPLLPMSIDLQCFTMAHRAQAGDRLVLSVGTSSPHHVPTLATDVGITVHTGPSGTVYALPRMHAPALYCDVGRFEDGSDPRVCALDGDVIDADPAQPPVTGNVLVPLPGLGVAVEPATAASFPFTVESGWDNARLEVLAQPSLLPADIDLILQQQQPDGAWADVASAATGSLSEERLSMNAPDAGEYRLIVHNWAGAAADVAVTVTFFNAAGQAGTG